MELGVQIFSANWRIDGHRELGFPCTGWEVYPDESTVDVRTMRSWRSITEKHRLRRGATTVELAVTLPVFCIILAGLMEFSHAMMVIHVLNAAARQGARYGAVDDISTLQVETRITALTATTTKGHETTIVKDGSVFDTANFNPSSIDYAALPNKELSSADDDEMFIVRVSVPYNDVALLPPFWAKNLTLTGQAVMRHE